MPRNRDSSRELFTWWVKQCTDPKFRNAIPLGRLKHFENKVEAAAKRFNLDYTSAADRELLLRILSAVHFPHVSDSTWVKLTAPRRGNPRFVVKWDAEAMRQLKTDISKVWKNWNKQPTAPVIADKLQNLPSKYKDIQPRTLIRQVQTVLRGMNRHTIVSRIAARKK
jgi:hypothetical protein